MLYVIVNSCTWHILINVSIRMIYYTRPYSTLLYCALLLMILYYPTPYHTIPYYPQVATALWRRPRPPPLPRDGCDAASLLISYYINMIDDSIDIYVCRERERERERDTEESLVVDAAAAARRMRWQRCRRPRWWCSCAGCLGHRLLFRTFRLWTSISKI